MLGFLSLGILDVLSVLGDLELLPPGGASGRLSSTTLTDVWEVGVLAPLLLSDLGARRTYKLNANVLYVALIIAERYSHSIRKRDGVNELRKQGH